MIKLIILDPGHFHASLLLQEMYPNIDKKVSVFAPEGQDLHDFRARVSASNSKEENPTCWELNIYKGEDFLDKMLKEKPGSLVIISGSNSKKIAYIEACINVGFHVLADKPLIIQPRDYKKLKSIFKNAEEKALLLFDIMTERFEITSILQKSISEQENIFGHLIKGSIEEAAISIRSVHHFFKSVSGMPILRPARVFDIKQEGEAIADVGTHLVDLVLWTSFAEGVNDPETEIQVLNSKHWSTQLDSGQFKKVTGLSEFPEFLSEYIKDNTLHTLANSSLDYTIKGTHIHISAEWNFEAEQYAGDTHHSIMQGSLSKLFIRQGLEEEYKPQLYIEVLDKKHVDQFERNFRTYIDNDLNKILPGISITEMKVGNWRINIPDRYRTGHEFHFSQVSKKFLEYLKEGKLPSWETKQMLTKYYTTIDAVNKAH